VKKTKKTSAQEKRRQVLEERRNRQLKVVIAVLLIAISAEAIYLASGSKYFKLDKIKISGNSRISTAKILKLSGLSLKDNVFRVDTVMAKKRVMGEPWIKSAAVAREFPLTIKITVVERQPVAIWLDGLTYYLLDTEGAVIAAGPAAPLAGIPIIKDAPPEDGLDTGEIAGPPAVKNALAVASALDKDILADIGWISAPTIDGLSIKLNSGPVIMYGKAEMAKQKNYAIKVILKEAANESKTWQYIDVRVPSNPVAKAVT
jgi:cell division protein FtsQ